MASVLPQIGSQISLISRADIRYEGQLFTVDPVECTIALSHVRSYGTEDRETTYPVDPQPDVYDYILFRGSDIKDIKILSAAPAEKPDNSSNRANSSPEQTFTNNAVSATTNIQKGNANNVQNESFPSAHKTAELQPQQPATKLGFVLPPMRAKTGHTSSYSSILNQPNMAVGSTPRQPVSDNLKDVKRSLNNHQEQSHEEIKLMQSYYNNMARSRENDYGYRAGQPRLGQAQEEILIPARVYEHTSRQIAAYENARKNEAFTRYRNNNAEYQHPEAPPGRWYSNYHMSNKRSGGNWDRNGGSWERTGGNWDRSGGNWDRSGGNWDRSGGNWDRNGGNWYRSGGNWDRNGPSRMAEFNGNDPMMNQFHAQLTTNYRSVPRPGTNPMPSGNKKPAEFNSEYDFEQANIQFEELKSQFGKVKISDVDSDDSSNKDETSGKDGSVGGDQSKAFYDKKKSFFDSISCDAIEKSKGFVRHPNWKTERKLNSETFGTSAVRSGSYRGGRGGYYQNRGGPRNFRTYQFGQGRYQGQMR